MTIEFEGNLWFWKGPAPHYFVVVPPKESAELKAIQGMVTYGWGMIPVTVRVGASEWTTALFPKDGRFLVPIKVRYRKAEGLEEGMTVAVRLDIALGFATVD